ncbi:hypothetical protein OERS_29380 [Oerskovia enterophila]|uniref:DUF4177 domain-containing protein n=2 Tax=Oerskovia enterophila TaxID=43678 RepID=A0ABX2Y643_9CELL|nr:hypothetical protein OERS_29380 [Oerskovia enterophila]
MTAGRGLSRPRRASTRPGILDLDERHGALTGPAIPATLGRMATTWEYATIPLIIHNTKAVLDQWGSDGWELVQVVTGPDGNGLVAYLKRPTSGQ